jgi:hypothetical protein
MLAFELHAHAVTWSALLLFNDDLLQTTPRERYKGAAGFGKYSGAGRQVVCHPRSRQLSGIPSVQE